MATSDERAEQRTVIQFCIESGMTPLNTVKANITGMYHGIKFTNKFQDSRVKTNSKAYGKTVT